ncbi:hypothetical protein LCGC14_1423120 [marine sediment metagenome]|uniref:Uncharacterized protein n=1 Tax=marine sediment metagenome TaxID=412755 RepID=A0A0F9JR94_9ZZZZ
MIRPTRHLDLNTCVLNVATKVADRLRREGPAKYALLLDAIQDELGSSAKIQFPLSVSLLYLLGVVEYDEKADVLFRVTPAQGSAT